MGRFSCKNRKCRMGTGIGISVFGLAVILFGIFFSHFILQEFQSGLHKSLILPSDRSTDTFKEWQNDNEDGSQIEHFYFYIWNLTNLEEVVDNGANPHMEELGPYVYREYKDRFNVTFSDDENLISYNEKTTYIYDKSMSCDTCNEDDVIINMWPTYVTLLREAGGYPNAAGVLASAMMNLTLSIIHTAVKFSHPLATPEKLNKLTMDHFFYGAGIRGLVPKNKSIAQSSAIHAFLRLAKMEIVADILEEMVAINVLPEYAFSVRSHPMTISYDAMYAWAFDPSNHSYACALGAQRSPDPDPSVGCATYFMELVQNRSSQSAFPLDGGSPGNFAMLSYLLDTASAALSALAALAGSPRPYGGSVSVNSFLSIGGGAWKASTVTQWLYNFDDPFLRLQDVSPSGSTGGADDAYKYNTAYFANNNQSSIEESWRVSPFTTIVSTGKKDIGGIDAEVGFQSHTTLAKYNPSNNTGFFCGGAHEVTGVGDDQPFAPGNAGWFSWESNVKADAQPHVWVDEAFRPIYFQYREDRKYRDITVKRFEIAESEFTVQTPFDIAYPGVINMTCVNHGTPVQLTLPHYAKAYGMKESWRVDGVGPVIEDEHLSFLDVEPITGSTLIGFERIQLNLFVQGSWYSDSTNAQEKLVPALWACDTAHMSDKEEHEFKSQVLGTLHLQRVLFITCMSVGSVAVVGGAIFWFWAFRSQDSKDVKEDKGTINYQFMGNKADGDDDIVEEAKAPTI
mmetsp:Transcript_31052/g.59952  ORF Transcript_31052/g.59952 Transcript_31052/m.59952 type:complete len:738 (+) Transcript_31052:45-2258(+)